MSTIYNFDMREAQSKHGFNGPVSKGRLILAELILKAAAGYRNSHTEEAFLKSFALLKADRTPNKKGFRFLCEMFYNNSNLRAEAYYSMKKHRIHFKDYQPDPFKREKK